VELLSVGVIWCLLMVTNHKTPGGVGSPQGKKWEKTNIQREITYNL